MNPPSATLRPRNRRRTRETEDNGSLAAPSSLHYNDATSTSKTSSRATSPIPPTGSSQASKRTQEAERSRSSSRFLGVPSLLGSHVAPSTFASGLWETSWSSMRGIASELIGSGASRASSPGLSPGRKRRPLVAAYGRNTSAPPSHWGPSTWGDKQLASGTEEDRRAKVQAKKREALLMANGHITPDSSGRFKRRDSDDRNRSAVAPRENEDRDALVYLHQVKPGDTLAGVMIKYNCQPNVFRRANRLWPNDSIQVRKTVVLPVDACGVRGRKIPHSELASHNIFEDYSEEFVCAPRVPRPPWGDVHDKPEEKETSLSSVPTSPSISTSLSGPEEQPWKHDSWVMIDGFQEAVEIARLSRRALGYFPRSRRKSQSFSDLETPSTSLDLPRPSYPSSSSPQPTRSRPGSGSGSGSYFATHLQGPGGVGTMSKNVRSPGPANDGLNKLFPTLQPTVAPSSSSESQHSNSAQLNGLENVTGAIEGWVRKVATKASTSLQPPTTGGRSGVGDLIELSEDAFELRDDHRKEEERREEATGEFGTGSRDGHWDNEQSRGFEEISPPRGRVIDKTSKGGS
ncbi:MAG: hypothetical protein Q9217_000549 [Psora testacea]